MKHWARRRLTHKPPYEQTAADVHVRRPPFFKRKPRFAFEAGPVMPMNETPALLRGRYREQLHGAKLGEGSVVIVTGE